jgi:putative ABC transport system substrate-binding protein
MRRRDVLAGLIGVFATPWIAAAQSGKVYRIGSLTRGGREAAAPYNRALAEALAALGWVEGRNVVFEHRYLDLKSERYPEIAAELARLGVDLIVAPSTPAALAVRRVAPSIPIVTTVAVDPVGAGLVASLARPGGNVTGLSNDTGPELGGKLLQLLKEAVPGMTRIVVLHEASQQPGYKAYAAAMETASKALGLSLHWVEVRGPADLDDAFAAIRRERVDAVVVAVQAMAITHARVIADFARRSRLATIARTREFAEAGGLMAYSTDIVDLYRRAAVYIDKIFKGARPGELPVERPTKFELAVNLKTAEALGLTIPQSLVMRADRALGR